MSESIELVVTDLPAAAHWAVARKCLNVSSLVTILTIDPIEDRFTHIGPFVRARRPRRKKQESKPIAKCITRSLIMA
jgi:hypothetical protein